MGGPGSGRRKEPTALRKLKGPQRKDRRNDAEPVPATGDVQCPTDLSDDARSIWHRLAPDMIDKGVLTPWDVDAFALLCDAITRMDRARAQLDRHGEVIALPVFDRNGQPTGKRIQKSPWWSVWRDAAQTALSYGARFGWTPSDRASLKVSHDDGGETDADLLTG